MAAPTFKDHFSRQSNHYAIHRPGYPAELYAWLAQHAPAHERVWDCATGNGQAAIGLVKHFAHVVASDGSAAQIRNRLVHARIAYLVALAEAAPLADRCCDLVTVAQSVHWFELDRFYAEVRRVLRPGGMVAVWTYTFFSTTPAVDAVLSDFYENVVGRYWPPERRLVEAAYRTLPFPFSEIPAPEFRFECGWTLEHILGYLASWSAVQRFKQAEGHDPLTALRPAVERAWGGPPDEVRTAVWPIHVRAGRV
ncbi:MAG TPA: class I SAM-dependent methyltransferase [Steroidobacteraceae bacterium]|nr:class I SAM-dependent methyltransferase [Steroidobacteraceae bacterium]